MNCRLLSTYIEGSTVRKAASALIAYVAAPFLIMRTDLVHLHLAGEVSLLRKLPIALCAKMSGRPFIVHVHASSPDSLFERTPSWAYRFMLGSARRVVALSESWATSIRHHVPKAAVIVVPNPVLAHPVVQERRSAGRISVVLFVGKLEHRKGFQDLLSAASLIIRSYPETQFWFAGHGDLARAEALAQTLGIGHCVRLLGWLSEEELDKRYSEATVFCLPSYNEGVPMSVLEAMSRGVPVVCTPVGGLPELIRHGHSGLFASPGDPESIAREIESLLGNPALSARIAAAGAATVQQNCGFDIVSGKLQTLYAEALRATQS